MLDSIRKIRRLLPKSVKKRLPAEIGFVKIGPEKSRTLNKIYRDKNKPTNVLSFYYGKSYGEILVCPPVIRKEARKTGNSYDRQMTWMILHGMLHLAGEHHEVSASAEKRVAGIEKSILKKFFANIK